MSKQKECKHCGELFNAVNSRKVFCSDNCRKLANARKNSKKRSKTNSKYYEKRKLLTKYLCIRPMLEHMEPSEIKEVMKGCRNMREVLK